MQYSLILGVALTLLGVPQSTSAQGGESQPYVPPEVSIPQTAMPVGFSQGARGAAPSGAQDESRAQAVATWFRRYDDVRRKAQMNESDRAKADKLMSKAFSMFIPGEEKNQAQKLLTSLVARYSAASDAMKQLPLYPETDRLHRGYYQYFSTARQLFSDYLTVQANPLAQDATGNPVAAGLLNRKQSLEALDQANKALDAQLRSQWNVPAYEYK
ncbi:MAG: hypothetical protein K2X93_02130 [Candidatus Obscuribacterales bacterium]|nr:hypothetical protein [Candidatus Obscuribacterales bacterium]